MSHSRRMPRLLAVAMLVVAGYVAVLPTAAGAEPLAGIGQPALVALCERYQGTLLEKLPPPYRYGCELPDGRIGCLETTECSFHRLDGRPPFEESCERGHGKYRQQDVATYSCWTEVEEVLLVCDGPWEEDCRFGSEPHEQPMPKPSH